MSSYLLVSRPRSTCARWRRFTRTRPGTSPPSAWPSGGRTSRTRTSHPTGQVRTRRSNIVTKYCDWCSLFRILDYWGGLRPDQPWGWGPAVVKTTRETTLCPDHFKLLLELDWIWNISFCLFPVLLEWLSIYFIVPFRKETPPLYHHKMMSIYANCIIIALSLLSWKPKTQL